VTALARCPLCASDVELVELDGELPFVVRCGNDDCPATIYASHRDYVIAVWNSSAAIELPEPVRIKRIKRTMTWATDPRTRALVKALHEIEAGGPAGVAVWGTTGLRDHARKVLLEAGLLSDRAKARYERENGVTLQATRTEE